MSIVLSTIHDAFHYDSGLPMVRTTAVAAARMVDRAHEAAGLYGAACLWQVTA